MPPPDLTPAERRLRGLLIGHAVLCVLLAAGYAIGGETSVLAFLPNSFAKDILFAALSLVGAADVRRFDATALLLVLAYVALIVGELITLVIGGAPAPELPLIDVSATVALLAWMAVDALLAVWLFAWWSAAEKARHGLRYLHPVGFHALRALSEVAIEGRAEVLAPEAVARNVDGYLAGLQARGKWRVQGAFLLVGVLSVIPLPLLAPDARKRFLQRRLLDDAARRRLPRPLRRPIQAAVRTAMQMAYLGYYGDRSTWRSIGYVPYAERPGATRPPDEPAVPPLTPLDRPPAGRYDAIVVGSGPAGAILAHRFAAAGRRVLVLERGPYAPPSTFTDDEVGQYLRLYNEGALQLATNFSLQVLQGMCVGGGAAINNGLCLPPPAAVLDAWADRGIDRPGLERAIGEVRRRLGVRPIRADRTSRAAQRFGAAAQELGLPGRLEVMEANITDDCRGCGYCNIGCAFDARRAALDTILPSAQRDHPGMLDVLPDFHVEAVEHRGGTATGVRGRHAGGAAVTLAADTVVIAAGAIGSSALLLRSRLGGDRVGRDLHFNVNSPLTADFPDPVDAFDGIQMSHAYVAGGDPPEYLVETWFNPPATQALATPGWFDRHFELMHRFRHLACAGVLVGTTTPGRVTSPRGDFTYEASDRDRTRLFAGLEVAARIFLAAGARRVMPTTFTYREFDDAGGLAAAVRESGDLLMTSAHPQGGNAIGTVVEPDFRVRGTRNVYLCDASAFPSCVRVNPQLTVMGLAEYAARGILGADLPAPPEPENLALR